MRPLAKEATLIIDGHDMAAAGDRVPRARPSAAINEVSDPPDSVY